MLLWLWCRLAGAAPILPLGWELPYVVHAALKRKKRERLMGLKRLVLHVSFIMLFSLPEHILKDSPKADALVS